MARKSRFEINIESKTKTTSFLAGIYTRLSIEDNDDMEQNSIGNQKKIILNYLKDKNDIAVVDYYVDNGYTGMNFNRPDFQRMMEDLRSGRINCVIVKDISRLGRHFVMTSEFVEKIFPMMQIRLVCINDDYDSLDEYSDSSSLLMPFKMIMNDSYVKDISKKIRSSISSKMKKGTFLPSASSIPYGYVRNVDENTFDIDEETAPIVRRIFEMRANEIGISGIAKVLNEEQIPSPGKIRFLRGITKATKYENSLWVPATIRKILHDQVYIGNRVHGRVKRDKVGLDKTRRSEEEWQVIENTHQPIITKELFEKVQQVMKDTIDKRSSYKHQKDAQNDNREILKGKIYCGDCGHLMRAHKGLSRANKQGERKAYIYYDCGKYVDSGRLTCTAHYVRESEILEMLQNTLDNQLRIAVDLEQLLLEIKSMPKVTAYQSDATNQLLSTQTKRRNMEKRLEMLLIDFSEGLIDKQEYVYAKQQYNAKYELLLDEEANMMAKAKELDTILSKSEQWLNFIKEYERFPKINRKVVEYLLNQITIYSNKRMTIDLNFEDPFKKLTQYLNKMPEVVDNG